MGKVRICKNQGFHRVADAVFMAAAGGGLICMIVSATSSGKNFVLLIALTALGVVGIVLNDSD